MSKQQSTKVYHQPTLTKTIHLIFLNYDNLVWHTISTTCYLFCAPQDQHVQAGIHLRPLKGWISGVVSFPKQTWQLLSENLKPNLVNNVVSRTRISLWFQDQQDVCRGNDPGESHRGLHAQRFRCRRCKQVISCCWIPYSILFSHGLINFNHYISYLRCWWIRSSSA